MWRREKGPDTFLCPSSRPPDSEPGFESRPAARREMGSYRFSFPLVSASFGSPSGRLHSKAARKRIDDPPFSLALKNSEGNPWARFTL